MEKGLEPFYCKGCGGQTYSANVGRKTEMRIRVRHADGCELLAKYMEFWPRLYANRLQER